MSKKHKKLFFIFASFTILALFLVADPMNLAIIDEYESVIGPVSKGDFLILFSVFGTTVTIVMFLFTGRWRTKR